MPAHRLYANDLAGGGILDVGCYPVSMARLIAGAASGKPFLDPVEVSGIAHLGKSGVDEWAAALLKFPNEIMAEVSLLGLAGAGQCAPHPRYDAAASRSGLPGSPAATARAARA